MPLSRRARQVSPSETLQITAAAKRMIKEGKDVVAFGAGEPDFDTPEIIKNAAIKAIQEGFTKYTPASGIPELKEAIAKKLKAKVNLIPYSAVPDLGFRPPQDKEKNIFKKRLYNSLLTYRRYWIWDYGLYNRFINC